MASQLVTEDSSKRKSQTKGRCLENQIKLCLVSIQTIERLVNTTSKSADVLSTVSLPSIMSPKVSTNLLSIPSPTDKVRILTECHEILDFSDCCKDLFKNILRGLSHIPCQNFPSKLEWTFHSQKTPISGPSTLPMILYIKGKTLQRCILPPAVT